MENKFEFEFWTRFDLKRKFEFFYFVGKDLARFFVDGEFGAFLVGLLDDRVLDLAVDALIGIGGLDADDWAAVRSSFFDFGTVGAALGEDGLVVVDVGDEDDHDGRRRVSQSSASAAGAVVDGRHVELVLVAIQTDAAAVQADDARQLLDDKLAGSGAAADESEADVVAVLVGSHDRRHQRVGPGVLVHVGRVHALREFRLLVVLVLGVDADGGRAGFGRFAFVAGRDGELVVSVVVVGVQLLAVADDAVRVDGEMIVRHGIFNFGVGTGIRVGGFHFEDGRADGNVFVDVVGLVIGQLELGYVVVDIRHANCQLKTSKGNGKLNERNGVNRKPRTWRRLTSTDVENPPESSVAVTCS